MFKASKVNGIEGLRKKLRSVTKNVERAASKASSDTADFTADTAREFVPVDSGALRDAIEVESFRDSYRVGPRDDIEYAPFIEWGTSVQAPQPYMTPAAVAARVEHRRNVAENVSDALKRGTR